MTSANNTAFRRRLRALPATLAPAALSALALSLPLLLAATAIDGAAMAKVGVTSTAAGKPLGTPPAQPERVLQVGIDVFANERITTAANDRAHLLFLDGSSLTVGTDADITIDRYVYDPATRTGELSMNAAKGVFRLVGGRITKTGGASVKVGNATIGIRGGIAIIDATNPAEVKAFFLFGESLTFTTPGGTQTAVRPNSVIVGTQGSAPNAPVIASPEQVAEALGSLEGSPGQTGGTAGAGQGGGSGGGEVDQKLASSDVGDANSGQSQATTGSSTGAGSPTQTANDTTGAGSGTGSTPDTSTPTTGNSPPSDGGSQPPPPVTVTISSQGRFLRDVPYTGFDNITLAAARVPANNAYLESASVTGDRLYVVSESGPTFDVPWQPGQVFAVTNANSTSSLGPVEGAGFVSPNGDFYIYDLEESANANNGVGFFGGELTPVSGLPTSGIGAHQVVPIPGRVAFLPDSLANVPVVADATPGLVLHAWSPVLDTTAASSSTQRSVWMQSTVNISGQGGAQSSFMQVNIGTFFTDETKDGNLYTGGASNAFLRASAVSHTTRYVTFFSSAETEEGSAVYGPGAEYVVLVPENTSTVPGPVTTRTPGAGFQQPFNNPNGSDYYYVTPLAPATVPAGVGDSRTSRTMNGYAAALIDTRAPGDVYSTHALLNTGPLDVTITTDALANRATGVFALSDPSTELGYTIQLGSLSGLHQSASAFIDDKNFAMRHSNTVGSTYAGGTPMTVRVDMVTAGNNPDSDWLPAGVSFCACEYMAWGYWQADFRYDDAPGPRAGERDRAHLGTWVAGELPDLVDMPLSGTATYSGHMIGNVENTFNKYVAAGSFSNSWNFGTQSGSFNATFDGGTYAGTMQGSPYDVNFSGNIAGAGGATGRTGDVAGSFFRSPSDAAAYQAGSFNISGPNYKAVGTFAGQR